MTLAESVEASPYLVAMNEEGMQFQSWRPFVMTEVVFFPAGGLL